MARRQTNSDTSQIKGITIEIKVKGVASHVIGTIKAPTARDAFKSFATFWSDLLPEGEDFMEFVAHSFDKYEAIVSCVICNPFKMEWELWKQVSRYRYIEDEVTQH